MPRITIAQKLDVLSSQAKVAGHRAVMEASYHFERFHSAEITAAGKNGAPFYGAPLYSAPLNGAPLYV